MRPCTYEITFTGRADRTLCAQFDDCTVTTGPDTTTLRAEVLDPAALSGLVQRITGLGLEVTRVYLLTPPAECPGLLGGPGQGTAPRGDAPVHSRLPGE